MLIFLVERGGFVDLVEYPVDPHARVASFLPFKQLFTIFALAPAHDRGKQV